MTNNTSKGMHPLLRGAIVGGSIGLMATAFGMDIARAFFLGAACGLLGAFTAHRIQEKRKK